MEQVLREATAFFGGRSDVHKAARKIARTLEGLGIDYAIVGALAVNAHGEPRMTSDVDVLVTPEGLARFKAACLGRGYVEKFSGSRGVRDTENKVAVDFLLTGGYPGDGKPKPIRFPEPSKVGVEGAEYRVLSLRPLIELKLASGITAPHRLQDLADVIALIRARTLPLEFAEKLHPFVREKYRELWRQAQEPKEPA
ncbi:MAG TPA: hypothetical protein VFI25_04245 [Planctomycetota bacterium]|jgi:hypothetical protein|nr:hypothetical protein [Planctomycetota bacterium]